MLLRGSAISVIEVEAQMLFLNVLIYGNGGVASLNQPVQTTRLSGSVLGKYYEEDEG
jgi:hypothetical protein